MIIEKVTGHRYQQEITDRIVLPLRPPDTTAPQTDTTIPGPHPHGYVAVPDPEGNSRLVDITEQNPGAGGMISTAGDLDRFLVALFSGRLWGKTGSTYGYTDGMFTTRDLGRRLVYSFTPGHGWRQRYGARVNGLISAAFVPTVGNR